MKRQKISLIILGILFLVGLNAQQVALPPAPEAAAMKEYVDVPVNMYSGIPEMSIPIHAIQGREITVPITLSYHANGIRVAEEATWVGLGWNLSAGGMITREIRDKDDFGGKSLYDDSSTRSYPYKDKLNRLPKDPSQGGTNSFFFHPWNIETQDGTFLTARMENCGLFESYCEYESVGEGIINKTEFCPELGPYSSSGQLGSPDKKIDTEPDLFSFSFGGYSGKFIFDKKEFKYVPLSGTAIKIEVKYASGATPEPYWDITTPDGMIYSFGQDAFSRQTTYNLSFNFKSTAAGVLALNTLTCIDCENENQTVESGQRYISTWYLQKIVAPNGDQVDFIYNKETVDIAAFYNENANGVRPIPNYSEFMADRLFGCGEIVESPRGVFFGVDCISPAFPDEVITHTVTRVAYDRVTLSKIDCEYGEVRFETSSRMDLLGGEKLDAIKIYTGPETPSLNKTFVFNYSYFSAGSNGQNTWDDHIRSVYNAGKALPGNFLADQFNKRLKLKSLQEFGEGSDQIPAYQFSYKESPALPPKSSLAIDYWGYFNNANENKILLPQVNTDDAILKASEQQFEDFFSCGSKRLEVLPGANRKANENFAGGWLLNEVIYPTKGKLNLEFESNEYSFPPHWELAPNTGANATLGGNRNGQVWETPFVNFPTNLPPHLDKVNVSMYVGYDLIDNPTDYPSPPACSNDLVTESGPYTSFGPLPFITLPSIRIRSVDNSFSETYEIKNTASYGIDPNASLNQKYKGPIWLDIELDPGKEYIIEIIPLDVQGERKLPCNLNVYSVVLNWEKYELVDHAYGGGMRVSRTDLDDGRKKTISKLYKYPLQSSEGTPQALLVNHPKFEFPYFMVYPGGTFCNGILPESKAFELFRYSNSQVPIQNSYAGSFVGYSEVEVWHGEGKENGKSEYLFHNKTNNYNLGAQILPPMLPNFYDQKNGVLLEQIDYLGASEEKVRQIVNTYDNELIEHYWNLHLFTFVDPYSLSIGSSVYHCPLYRNHFFFYKDIRQWVKLLKTVETYYLDGGNVTKVTDYTYNTENFQIASTSLKDSDNRVYKTTYDYPVGSVTGETDIQATASLLSGYNIISTVIAERNLVDGVQTGGSKTTYQIAGGAIVPETLYQWEGTAWDPIGTFTSYYPDGFPQTFQKEYYNDPDEFEWYGYGNLSGQVQKKGLLAKKTYKDFEWKFDYYEDTRRLLERIEPDKTYANFTYDGLQRLKTIEPHGNGGALKSTTTINYNYGGPENNTVNTSIIYEADPTSSLTAEPKSSTKYYDGLGRYYKTIMHSYHKDANDVVTEEINFDNFGRVEEKTYLPGSMTLYTYEMSPLGRLMEQEFPDGEIVRSEYGSEENYYTQTSIDEKGNKTTNKIDLLGRTVKITDAEAGTTQYEYDNWGNIKGVTTPAGSHYDYAYDTQNRIISKAVPGGGTTTYGYADGSAPETGRDLLVWEQFDEDQNGQKIQISYQYDDYDRVIETFLGNLGGESLIKNEYYKKEESDHIDKIKVTHNKKIGLDGNTSDTYVYDQFGRVEQYDFAHHIGTDGTTNLYDLADRLRKSTLAHNGYQGLSVISETTYDMYDRLLTNQHQIDQQGPELIAENIAYSKRDELEVKLLGGGLQTFNYQYHKRGWLTQINEPLGAFGQLGLSCKIPEVVEGEDTPETGAKINIEQLTLEEFLRIRFEVQLKIQQTIDEQPCPILACPVIACSPAEVDQQTACLAQIRKETKDLIGHVQNIPCEDGTSEEVWTVDVDILSFPVDLLRVALCDGSETYILASYANKLCGNYVVQQLIPVNSAGQLFTTRDPELPTQLDLEEVLTLIGEGQTPTLNGYTLCGEPVCPSTPIDCSTATIALQQTAIAILKEHVPEITVEDLPIYLYEMLTCTGETFYILEDEYPIVEHSKMEVIDTIIIDSLTQPIPVDYTIPKNKTACNDIFYLKLDYEPNGNIKTKTWQVANRNQMKYDFSYDKLNRLKDARYSERIKVPQATSGGPGIPAVAESFVNMNENRYGVPRIEYDPDGNITHLSRIGIIGACSPGRPEYGLIDNLTYTYAGPNRLQNVTDDTGIEKGFNPGGGSGDYQYDKKGNLISDPYKGLTIKYNYLNLPEEITKGGSVIKIIYDAAGRKLRQEFIPEEGEGVLLDYVSGIEYRDEALNSVFHAEGRAFKDKDKDKWQYEYFIKDHLGNTHLSVVDLNGDGCIDPLSDPSEVLQENHYYPFGLNMDGLWARQYLKEETDENGNGILDPVLDEEGNSVVDQEKLNRYQYNGKELTEDLGLNWNDYGARWYDAAVGRWGAVDPLAEKYFSLSPYNYVSNNPLVFVDLYGMDLTISIGGNGFNSVAALVSFLSHLNESTDNKVQFNLTSNGNNSFDVSIDKSKSDINGLSKSGGAFYKHVSAIIDDKKTTNIDLVYGSDQADNGNFYSKNSAPIDMRDIEQFPINQGYGNNRTASRSGKLIHELVEQYYKQTKPGGSSFSIPHSAGMSAESDVDGLDRVPFKNPNNKYIFPKRHMGNNTEANSIGRQTKYYNPTTGEYWIEPAAMRLTPSGSKFGTIRLLKPFRDVNNQY
ncbi:MAG: RHS repeat-associated core domain-containing protein [Saprospiraceae bacterium]